MVSRTAFPFGVIGCGLMGREFVAAAARWCQLLADVPRPEIVAVCTPTPADLKWFTSQVPSVGQATSDYRELLRNPEVKAVYVAVPHHLHEEIYCAVLDAGKHLMGEKPFGIDRPANSAILGRAARHSECLVRCASEFPFYPALHRIGDMIDAKAFGAIIEATTGFLHSSDLDTSKPFNWKRKINLNGAYGCMGDLGMHVLHMPLRAGWKPRNVRAILSKIVRERPDGQGSRAACETWDNATLLLETEDPSTGSLFPMTVRTDRIAPGEKNTWSLEILGMKACARFSTKRANLLEVLEYAGGEQAWRQIDMGHEAAYASITGKIFECGFSDAILQMWAAFMVELEGGRPPKRFAGCVTPGETRGHHDILTAALESQASGGVEQIGDVS